MEKLRACIVTPVHRTGQEGEERRGYFHQWGNISRIVDSSAVKGGGVLLLTVGIVEYEDGTVDNVYPYQIKFTEKGNKK